MSTIFENIFSRKHLIIKETPKITGKIIADYREKNSLVPANLIKLGFEVEFRELKVADFIIKDTVIERKTVSDFISSMINKRLSKQLEELQQYPSRLLIIEGIDEQELYTDSEEHFGVNPNAIRGFLLSILLRYNVPIIYTKNSEDTARFISVLYKKETKEEISFKAKKHSFSKKEQLQFILEGFPGIGPKNAKKLLKKFKTIKEIINASEEELKKLLGKKAESIIQLREQKY